MRLQDKVALITGAGSGFGRAAAILFAKEGAKVAVVDVNDQGGGETVRLIKEAGGEASYVHTDVGVVAEVEKMIKAAVKTYGKLNIFWHNAGTAGPGRVDLTTEEAYDRCLAVNLKGGFFGAKFAIPEITKSGGGSILFTSSIAGVKPSHSSATYSIAKTGLVMLTRCLALQLAKSNIRVNAIAPGPVKTGMWGDFIGRPGELVPPEEQAKRIIENTPMGRFGTTEDIARAALYLVSDEASFVTGVILPVDGGHLAR